MEKRLLELKEQYEVGQRNHDKKSNSLSRIRILLFLLFLILVLFYSSHPSTYIIILLWILAIAFCFVVIVHSHIDKERRKYEAYITIIEKYEERKNGNWKSVEEDGMEMDDTSLLDLGVFGKNSLFQYLNFTSSLGGYNRLRETLTLKEVSQDSILDNQKSIEEIKNNLEFILFFQEKLTHVKNIHKIDFKETFPLFDAKEKSKKVETIISILFSLATIISFILTCLQILSPLYFGGFFFFQLAASHIYTVLYKEEYDSLAKCVRAFNGLYDTYQYIDNIDFHSKKNKSLQEDIQRGKDNIRKLNKISNLNVYRFNFITNILFNVFFSLNFIVLYKYTELLGKESESLKKSLYALEEFEVLVSLTTVGLVKEEVTFPVINTNVSLDLENMKHPLLEESACIPNNFRCSQDIQIITGSNMSGKTSFMKTIGINLVLAYSGTYVNAKSFSCSIMKIFTSINVKDDISNGISTFYGELQRIKNALDFSKNRKLPMIVFIDEIFKGTNYNDRILGAKEVLKKLSKLPCIVFLTTHDFELCEINDKKIHNYHFEETYKKNKISFDYRIKKGQCTTTNAKYLMKQVGIID